MSSFGGIVRIIGVAIAVVAAGVLIGWLGSRSTTLSPPPENPTPHSAGATSGAAANPGIAAVPRGTNAVAPRPGVGPGQTALSGSAPVGSAPVATLTNWEERVDSILGTEGEESDKAKQMLAFFPQLPPEGQVEVAQHLSNLILDEDYAPLGALLTDASLSEDVLDVLMGDLLNRPNSVKLPLLVDVARNGQHPKAAEAKDLLELFLEEDYGADWNVWQAKAQEWLQANPD